MVITTDFPTSNGYPKNGSSHRRRSVFVVFQPFTIAEKRPILPGMTISRPLHLGQSFRFEKNGLHSVTANAKFKMSLLLVLE